MTQISRRLRSVSDTGGVSGKANDRLHQLLDSLQAIDIGIMIVDRGGEVRICNSAAAALLDLPRAACAGGFTMADMAPALARIEIAPGDDPASVVVARPPDRFIELRARAMPQGGAVILIEDRSRERTRELALQQIEAEHQSLFDNSVYGIYRDTLDGRPIRVNPALAAMNGYGSEAEHIEAVQASPMEWYVVPGRSGEFRRLLEAEGRVKDFVSEIYRHHTRERVWITENAWYVRDAAGNPLFIEGTIQDATERIMAHSEIERLANIDTLTGISSRFRFLNRLHSETRRAGASCALFCVDLDRFKEVNDTLGHAAGDAVLKCVAQALLAITGNGESVARLGGDEFAVLMSGSQGGADAEIVAARIVAALGEPISFDGQKIIVGASVGVAMFPGHASDAESLLHNADLALYEVKSSGRNGYRLYDSEMNIRIQQRKDIVRELRTAAATDALEVHYQPVVNSDSGRTVGFEALMRWNRPAMGPIPPGIFIPIAEEAGLMTQLGAWVISRACEDLALLPPGIRMGINVSANQFRSPDLFAHIKDTIARTGIDPTRLVFEITESVLVSNADVARGLLENLRGVGAQIALDDFGTGYSALGYLQQFPITVVKIDQSFIAGMLDQKANQAVIRAIMGIGRDLDIDVVAEGVETIGQVEALQGYGCRFMQGYFFGKARPLTDVITDLAISKLNDDPPKPHPERAYAIKLS